jgi:hypothetical protein
VWREASLPHITLAAQAEFSLRLFPPASFGSLLSYRFSFARCEFGGAGLATLARAKLAERNGGGIFLRGFYLLGFASGNVKDVLCQFVDITRRLSSFLACAGWHESDDTTARSAREVISRCSTMKMTHYLGLLIKDDVRFLGMPFLRRYEPALPFPFFFAFCTLLWIALTTSVTRISNLFASFAGLTFAVLLFSYFYLWTAAAAFFVCTAFLWLITQRGKRHSATRVFIIASVPALSAFPFYLALVSHLPATLDKAQTPIFTHRPDLLRTPELLAISVLIVLFVGVRREKISFADPRVIFTASLALLPIVVLNQQVLTGYTVQPYHFAVLVLSYTVLVTLVIAVDLLLPLGPRAGIAIVVSSLLWGAIEINAPFQERYKYDVANDEIVPVLVRLNTQAASDGTWDSLRERGQAPLVFSPEYQVSTLLPTWAPQGTLLATAGAAFQSLSETEAKERLYTHLYYSRKDSKYVRGLLTETGNDPLLSDFAKSTIFRPERVLPFIAVDFDPIRPEEIEESIRTYDVFLNSFSLDNAAKRPLAYAVTLANSSFDFSNLDLWYERDNGERVGAYTLYRLKLRSESSLVRSSAP